MSRTGASIIASADTSGRVEADGPTHTPTALTLLASLVATGQAVAAGRRRGRNGPADPAAPEDRDPVQRILRPSSRTRAAIAWAVGIGLALAAQLLLDRGVAWIPLPGFVVDALRPTWPDAGPVLSAILLFVLAAVCFATGVTRIVGTQPEPSMNPELDRDFRPGRVGILLGSVGLLAFLGVLAGLALASYQPYDALGVGIAAALVLAALASAQRGRRPHRLLPPGWRRPVLESGAVVAFVGAFVWLNWVDLRSWYYASIGEEFAFYDAAKLLALGQTRVSLFAEDAARAGVPWMSALAEGMLMRLVGTDVAGWRMAVSITAALGLVGTYLLARLLFGRLVALLALGFLAASHYLLAYAHSGLPNLEALLPATGSFWCFNLGIRRDSPFLLVLSGVLAGLGWYTYATGRAAIVLLAIATFLTVRSVARLRVSLAVAGGFALTFLPVLAANKAAILASVPLETNDPSMSASSAGLRLLENTGRSVLAFNYNVQDGPYLYGSLLEPLTAALFVLGLAYVLATWRDRRSRFAVAWFCVGIAGVGIFSTTGAESLAGLSFLLPLVAMLAGLAVERMLVAARRVLAIEANLAFLKRSALGRLPDHVYVGSIIVAVLGIATFNNLSRWFVDAPAHLPIASETMAVHLVELPQCQSAPRSPLIVGAEEGPAMARALLAVPADLVPPVVAPYDQQGDWLDSAAARCVIFPDPNDGKAQDSIRSIVARWPENPPVVVTDPTGAVSEQLFYPLVPR